MKKQLSSRGILLFLFLGLFGATNLLSQGIHIRKGVCSWGDYRREYQFNDVPESIGYLTRFPIEDIRSRLSNKNLKNWNIEYHIFTSIEDAELAMVELLDMSNLYMYNIIDSTLSQGQLGDNCWHQLSVGAIRFIKNNVLVTITPKISDSSIDNTDAESIARKIESTIAESEKVDKATLIPAPEIQSVEILSDLPRNWEDTAEVLVNASDPNSRQLHFREYATGFAIVSETGQLTVSFNKNTDLTDDTSKAKVKIWIWNEDFLTSSVLAEIPFSTSSVINNHELLTIPETFTLEQNYPNPFNASTVIRYGLPEPALVSLKIYNIAGREIITLTKDNQSAGVHQYTWNGKNSKGVPVSSGVYYYRLETDSGIRAKRMMLLK